MQAVPSVPPWKWRKQSFSVEEKQLFAHMAGDCVSALKKPAHNCTECSSLENID